MTDRAAIQITLEFDVQNGGANITWRAPILGRRYTAFAPPYDPAALALVVKALDALQYPGHPGDGPQFSAEEQGALAALGLWRDGRVPADASRKIGMALYDALGPDGRGAIENVRSE